MLLASSAILLSVQARLSHQGLLMRRNNGWYGGRDASCGMQKRILKD